MKYREVDYLIRLATCLFILFLRFAASGAENHASLSLARIIEQIGEGVTNLGFRLNLDDGATILTQSNFQFTVEEHNSNGCKLVGKHDNTRVLWEFSHTNQGVLVKLTVSRPTSLRCRSMDNLIVGFSPTEVSLADWRLLGSAGEAGMPKLSEIESGSLASKELAGQHQLGPEGQSGVRFDVTGGIFPNSRDRGLFIGTMIPQSHTHKISVERPTTGVVNFVCTTSFIEGPSREHILTSESVWVCATRPARLAIDAFASFYSEITPPPTPPSGWNSWDYYFNIVTLDDIAENMDALKRVRGLSGTASYIVVDDGWQTSWGDWYPNHRFPSGLEKLSSEIRARGFIPGIWTAPMVVHFLTTPGLRHADMLVRNEHGDPFAYEPGRFILDTTHPKAQAFVRELYTRLYRAGFRYFKIDYLNTITQAPRLHDSTKGQLDAVRDFLKIVRESVGADSFILGCDMPMEVGPGLVNAARLGIDIHNQWTHVPWVFDSVTQNYWMHNRLWINDPDFLIVRGVDTSMEKVTNVTNPRANQPNPPRWRRGSDFNYEEAKTWASIIMLTGGSAMMSDRISVLNQKGFELLRKSAQPTGVRPEPLDLCDNARASLWLQKLPTENRLTVINWSEAPVVRSLNLEDYGIKSPAHFTEFWTGEKVSAAAGVVNLKLPPHGTAILTWTSK